MSFRDYVWRLVGPAGDGAYRAGITRMDGLHKASRYWNHPGPWEDPVSPHQRRTQRERLAERLNTSDLFGFRSVTQARKWWLSRRDMALVEKAGFKLRAYRRADLAKVVEGRHQVIFRTKGAKPVDLPPTMLWDRSAAELHAAAAEGFARAA